MTAENFAFGPAGKLITVAEALAERGHELTFVGCGTAYQLASRTGCWDVVKCDTASPAFSSVSRTLFPSADALLSCMDRPSAAAARRAGLPTIWLDPLTWWWDESADWSWDFDLCIAQRSIRPGPDGGDRRTQRNLLEVGPIVDPAPAESSAARGSAGLLVNFGGGEAAGWYEVGKDTDYPFVLMEVLDSAVDLSAFEAVTVTANERIAFELRRRWPDGPFTFGCLGHRDFIRALRQASVFLTVPGLEAPLEAWTYEVPTVFMPPSNSSQYVQLDEYRRHGLVTEGVHLRDHYDRLELMALPLRERSSAFLAQLREWERDGATRAAVGEALARALADRERWPDLVGRGSGFIEGLGGNGLAACLNAVEGFLALRGRST
ncbi:hypothetical protein [Catenulispora pinistramenti]|nr:hypothetical protein [Catenulispora pinistramenti]